MSNIFGTVFNSSGSADVFGSVFDYSPPVLGDLIIPTYRQLTQSCFVGLRYNTAGQEFHVLAVNTAGRVSGRAALISAFQRIDGGDTNELTDILATEISSTGEYTFALSQGESAGHDLQFDVVIPEPIYDLDNNPLLDGDGKWLGYPYDVETPTVFGFGLPSNAIKTTKQYEIYNSLFGSDP